MSKKLSSYGQISLLRQRYFQSALHKENILKLILEVEVSDQVYNSNAIENSTLSLEETEKILQQIDLDRFISERDLFGHCHRQKDECIQNLNVTGLCV